MAREAVVKLLVCVAFLLPDATRAQTELLALLLCSQRRIRHSAVERRAAGQCRLPDARRLLPTAPPAPTRSVRPSRRAPSRVRSCRTPRTAFSSSWLQQPGPRTTPSRPAGTGFRFPSIPTQCVEVKHCGTQAPVRLSLAADQRLPGPLEVRRPTARAARQLFPGDGTDCCWCRIPVTVPASSCACCSPRRDARFRPVIGVLPVCPSETPDPRPTAPPPCGPDEAFAAGSRETEQPPPPSAPLIEPEAAGDAVYLRCSFAGGANASVGYVVAWSRLSPEGRREELKQETTVQTASRIELDGFNLRLGDKIYCSSSSFLLDSPDVVGASVESHEFFAGLRLIPESRTVWEDGRLHELVVESTVPVPCLESCSLSLQLSASHEGALGPDLSLSSCVLDLTRSPCSAGVCGRAVVHFSSITDFVKDDNRTTQISVKPIVTKSFLWSGYSPEPVQIQVKDVPSAYCYSFTDPHVITFDGRSYDNYQIGTFVLYRSTSWPCEVHVRQWECGSVEHAASCACGVVARDGDDIIAFDMCSGDMGESRPQLSVKKRGVGRSGLRITESYQGRKLTIGFSSGAFVRADVSDWGMSLTLRAPGSDWTHTEGLCGTYDGRPDNDLHSPGGASVQDLHAFISEWRLPPGSSLFDTGPANVTPLSPRQYCTCQTEPLLTPSGGRSRPVTSSDSSDSCSAHNVRLLGIIPTLDVTAEYMGSEAAGGGDGAAQRRGRRQTHRYAPGTPRPGLGPSDLEGPSYFFPEDHEAAAQPSSSPTWPTPSGLTERRARSRCRQAVASSSVASGCRRLLEARVLERAVNMCVGDLQLKDEWSWLSATSPLLENECERRLEEEARREELHQEAVAALRCPSACHGNGQCSQRGCVCFPGFGSYDCSALSDQIPEIINLEKGGLCDVRQGGCSLIRVHGQGFKDSYELKCEFVKEKFVGGEWVLDEPQFVLATFLDATALECQLPLVDRLSSAGPDLEAVGNRPLARWQIKVSNDGYSYSNAKILTVFDGDCQTCSLHTEVLCALKEKTCSIDGVCYAEGQSSPSSPCLTCRPESSRYAWSVAEKNQPPVVQPLPFHLRAFQGESFIYQLQAQDREGSEIHFSLVSGPGGAALSPSGLLTWTATAERSDAHTFHFTVTDDCNAQTEASLQVQVRSCDCLNGASCVTDVTFPAGSGEYLCVCVDGFRGRRCEQDIDDCKPNPCRLGRCVDRPNSFSCICPAGTTGRTCREDLDECAARPCFPGALCSNTLGSFSCGACPHGYSGDGLNCTLKAVANPPPRLKPPGSSPCSRRPCYPGVQCFESAHVSMGFVCAPCPPGFHGNGQTCTATGKGRDRADGHIHIASSSSSSSSPPTSVRQPHHRGMRPEATGSADRRTAVTQQNLTLTRGLPGGGLNPSLASRVTGGSQSPLVACADAPCFPGVACVSTNTGSFRCGRCPYGYTGDGVTCKAVCRYQCGTNMACTLPNTCTCKDGYTGYDCHIALCRPDCKNQGRCVKPNVCECAAGYGGPTCEEASCEPPCQHGGTCLARNLCTCPYGYVGPRCGIMVCNRHCEHGGECISPDVCQCRPGWFGPTCNSALCSPVCLNGGTCLKPNICACPSGFYGSQCQIAVCSPPCKNGGQCMRNNVCSCPEGYTGKRCHNSVCEPTCMNKGKCVGPNTCSCASGWRGKRCSIPVCLQKCKNEGECVGPNTCQCPAGWEGLQCQTPICKQRCLNGGRCVLPDYCHCRKGYTGLTCATKASQAR